MWCWPQICAFLCFNFQYFLYNWSISSFCLFIEISNRSDLKWRRWLLAANDFEDSWILLRTIAGNDKSKSWWMIFENQVQFVIYSRCIIFHAFVMHCNNNRPKSCFNGWSNHVFLILFGLDLVPRRWRCDFYTNLESIKSSFSPCISFHHQVYNSTCLFPFFSCRNGLLGLLGGFATTRKKRSLRGYEERL